MSRGTGLRNYMLVARDPRNGNYGLGISKNYNNLFNGGPLVAEGVIESNEKAKEVFVEVLRNPSATGGPDFLNVNMNYAGAGGDLIPPDYAGDIRSEKVSSHWVPNTTSPLPSGERTEAPDDSRYTSKAGAAPFEGPGSSLAPKTSTEEISNRAKTLGDYSFGSRPKVG